MKVQKLLKIQKFKLLTSRFDEIRMKECTTFDEFFAKLNNIANSS
jgi:hypothetical protein